MEDVDEKETKIPLDFFGALRNAQPIAFLASLSLIIATFTFTNFPNVYSNAIIASFMFIFSFVLSILIQIKIVKERLSANEPFWTLIRVGTYFFLAMGIIYLILIAVEFGKLQQQIFLLTKGWYWAFFGVFIIYTASQTIKKLNNLHGYDFTIDAALSIVAVLFGIDMSVMGLNALFHSFLGVEPLPMSKFTIFTAMVLAVLVYIKLVLRRKKKS